MPNALPPVDAFDAELLPLALRAWVMDIAHRMQCPADFPAVAALVYLFTAALTAAVTTINWQGGFSPGQIVFDFTIITGQAMLGAIVGALPASLWLKSRARRG